MTIRTVTTILSDTDGAAAQVDAAAGLARAMDAHLHVLALAIGIDAVGFANAGLDVVPTGAGIEQSVALAKALAETASEQLSKEDIRWHVDPVGVAAQGSRSHVAQHTRFSDLVVQLRLPGAAQREHLRTLAETVLFDADSPLLLLPEAQSVYAPPRNVMVCWDESAAALRAARQALPILAGADQAHIVLVNPPADAPDRSDPGGAFAQYLARHGIRCEVSVCNEADGGVAATIERRALELGCDMIVMGAYGHSRLRQAIFGGTTRDILTEATVPVFMAH